MRTLFNRYGTERSTQAWQVLLTPVEVKELEADGRSVRSPIAIFWPQSDCGPEHLIVLKNRWESADHLLV